jgi:hypothetical protein
VELPAYFPKALDGQCYRARKYPLVDPGVGVVCSCRVGSVAEVIAASFVYYIFSRSLDLLSRSFVVALVFFAASFSAGFFPRYARLS